MNWYWCATCWSRCSHELAWFKRRSQLRGGWGRRPKGDAPRSEAGALGARSLWPARPRHPALRTREDPGVEPCLIPCTSSLSRSRLPAWPVLRSPLRERPGLPSGSGPEWGPLCMRDMLRNAPLDEAASPRDGGSELGGLCRLGRDWPPRDSGVIPWYFRPCGWNSLVPTYETTSRQRAKSTAGTVTRPPSCCVTRPRAWSRTSILNRFASLLAEG